MKPSIEDFIKFASSYDPSFPELILGATLPQISRLEELVGSPLPLTYRSFLQFFGQNDGGLRLAFEGSTRIDEVIEYYEAIPTREVDPPPPACLVIGTGDYRFGEVCLQEQGAGEPRVVLGMDGRIQELYGDSLSQLMFRSAFVAYELRANPYSCIYVDSLPRDIVPLAREKAVQLGFVPHWFSDTVALCAERDDVKLIVQRFEGARASMKVASGTKEVVEHWSTLLAETLGMVFDRWWKP